MTSPFKHCEIYRTSNRSKIISILKKNQLKIDAEANVLIGSRAARHFMPTFRGMSSADDGDWDIVCSSEWLLKWLDSNNSKKREINSINMILPQSHDSEQFDLYIYCELNDGSKYDFDVPRSTTSYTAYILNNLQQWTVSTNSFRFWNRLSSDNFASVKLLLILKKYMLYYSHQWMKTAKDYRELLAISPSLTENDMELCHLFIKYNEKIHGKRPTNSDKFTISPDQYHATLLDYFQRLNLVVSTDQQADITIERDEFFRYTKEQQISLIYQLAMSLSYCDDIFIGLEYICTQSPLWLTDYTIENWIDILQEKFKYFLPPLPSIIRVDIENYRLFPEIPEIATKRILHYITDIGDFCSMQLVCKRWYAILDEEIFWRDLYISRFGTCANQTDQVYSWKLLYLIQLEGKYRSDNDQLNQLVEATTSLRQYTANNIVKLWEDLTHRDQSVKTNLLEKINCILLNSFYYEVQKTSGQYSVRLILIGLEHAGSLSKVYLHLRVGEYGSSRFADYMEQLSIQYEFNTKQISLSFFGPDLFGYHLDDWGYISTDQTYLNGDPSTICKQYPSGLLICLFIMMVHPDRRAQHIKYLKNIEHRCCQYNIS